MIQSLKSHLWFQLKHSFSHTHTQIRCAIKWISQSLIPFVAIIKTLQSILMEISFNDDKDINNAPIIISNGRIATLAVFLILNFRYEIYFLNKQQNSMNINFWRRFERGKSSLLTTKSSSQWNSPRMKFISFKELTAVNKLWSL